MKGFLYVLAWKFYKGFPYLFLIDLVRNLPKYACPKKEIKLGSLPNLRMWLVISLRLDSLPNLKISNLVRNPVLTKIHKFSKESGFKIVTN